MWRYTVSNQYNDKATRVDFDTLDKLCRLFDCDVGDLLQWDCKRNDDFFV